MNVYIDDALILPRTLDEHVYHMIIVVRIIVSYGLRIEISECHFAQPQTGVLSTIISRQGICVDQDMIKAILKAPEPKTVTKLMRFLGLAFYYQLFTHNFSGIAGMLHAATSKNKRFNFTVDMQRAFLDLRKKLNTPHLLAFPNFEAPFKVKTEDSLVAIGAVMNLEKRMGSSIQYCTQVGR